MVGQQNKHKRTAEVGQALVEYALLLSFMLILTISGIEVCRAVYVRNTVTYAAYEGARYGITHPTDVNGIRANVIRNAVGVQLAPTDITVECGSCTRGTPLTVYITYDFVSSFSLMVPSMTFTASAMYYIQ